MKKSLLKEFILPAFWVFFFTVSSKSDGKVNEIKEGNHYPVESGINKAELSAPGAGHSVNGNKETVKQAIFLSKY